MRSEPRSDSLDAALLAEAVELSRRSPPSPAAYAVGAVVVGTGPGAPRSVGWSRRYDALDHAEEVALAAFPGDPAGGTLYSSLEPCSRRRSRRRTCTELILAAGIARVVFALREPPLFADCDGAELLARAGVAVVELPELAGEVRAVNADLLG
jgi:diaminohydroxyphosphoribosylaminopyrimidine deaminase/5-amino-6-(5-phosphoribosylamino)uracil reductase